MASLPCSAARIGDKSGSTDTVGGVVTASTHTDGIWATSMKDLTQLYMCLPNDIPPPETWVEAENLEVSIIVDHQFPQPGRVKIRRENWGLIVYDDLTSDQENLEWVSRGPVPICTKRQINRVFKRIFAVVGDDGGSI